MLPKPYYEADGITIYCADNRDVLPHLGKFDLLLTDPPYGIGFASQPTKWQRKAGMQPKEWDESRVVLPDLDVQEMCIWGGNYFELPISRGWLCWYKPDAPPSMGQFELAWTNKDMNPKMIHRSIAATNPERVGHPTQKPLAVISWSLSFFPEAKTVLDPFCGSGTTLVAAKQRGLQAVGIEISEEYCELAKMRLAQGILIT